MARLIPYEDTTVSVTKSLAEIEDMLAVHHANKIMKEYESDRIKGLAFMVNSQPFALPVRTEGIFNYLLKKRLDSPRYAIREKARRPEKQRAIHDQAERVAWRNLAAWVKAQLAIVEIGMVQITEVFMPYLIIGPGEETIFQRLQSGGLPALMQPKDKAAP